jgi:branched-chain amino acid transport system substrate-binding protein
VFDRANAEGGINGRKIELSVEDDRGDPAAGVAAVTKLLDRDKSFLIYGGPFTPVTLATFPRVVERGRIYWSVGSSTPRLTDPFNRLIFQGNETLDDQSMPVAKLVASMKPTRVAFIRQNDEYGAVTHDATARELPQHGLKIDDEETIEPTAVSASAQVLRIKSGGADVVIFGGTPKAADAIIREMYKNGVKAPLVSFGGGNANALFDLVTGDAPIEYYAASALACSLNDKCTADFLKAWQAAFPNDAPISWAAHGYAASSMFVQGLRDAGPELTTDRLVSTFETMPPFATPILPFPIKFTAENHRGIHGAFFDGFKDGKHYFFGDELKG